MQFIQKAKNIYLDQGLPSFLVNGTKSLTHFIFNTNSGIWHIKDLKPDLPSKRSGLNLKYDFQDLDKTYSWLITLDIPWLINDSEYKSALKGNHFWPNVMIDGRIVGCIKVGYSVVYICDYRRSLNFPARTAVIYDTFILPDFRNKGICTQFVNSVCNFLRSQDFDRILCHIPNWNKASFKVFERNGFRAKRKIKCFQVFGFGILSYNPVHL